MTYLVKHRDNFTFTLKARCKTDTENSSMIMDILEEDLEDHYEETT
jgi:hypothetical protein